MSRWLCLICTSGWPSECQSRLSYSIYLSVLSVSPVYLARFTNGPFICLSVSKSFNHCYLPTLWNLYDVEAIIYGCIFFSHGCSNFRSYYLMPFGLNKARNDTTRLMIGANTLPKGFLDSSSHSIKITMAVGGNAVYHMPYDSGCNVAFSCR